MIYRVVDIETVPDYNAWQPPEKWKLAPLGEATWDPKARAMEPVKAGLVLDEPFAPPQAHRVVAIAWVDLHAGVSNPRRYHYRGFGASCAWDSKNPDKAERHLLEDFHRAMHDDGGDSANVMLITWNGRRFDLPVLSMRSLKHGVPFGWYYQNDDVRYRYKEEGHTDLMDYLSDYGSAITMKLGDIAKLIGLPGKTDMTGASVADIAREGNIVKNMERVRRYCLADSLQTALVYLRSMVHIGRIEPAQHDEALGTVRESEAASETGLDIDWNLLKVVRPS